MAGNRDTDAMGSYHDGTKHTFRSVRSGTHVMDRTNQPRPWKLYRDDLPEVKISKELRASGMTALDAIGAAGQRGSRAAVTLDALGALLVLSAGITKRLSFPGGTMAFRAAACTGALYHIELYVVAGELPGLSAGVYHYGVHDNFLRRLRDGDYRGALVEASAGEPGISGAQAVIAYTTTYWRNAWKYQARAYRHAFWDSGTIIANTLAVATAQGVEASVVAGFADQQVNRLLGVDPATEAAVALVPLGRSAGEAPAVVVDPLSLGAEPLSREEIDFPAIRAMHGASSLTVAEVDSWRGQGAPSFVADAGDAVTLPAGVSSERGLSERGLEEVIVRRGSTRRFDRSSIALGELATILQCGLAGTLLDAIGPGSIALNDVYVIANGVDGLVPGAYRYRREGHALEHLREGDVRDEAAHLALDQELSGDAAFNVYFLADLTTLAAQLGNRAYRAAHLDASIAAGRMYLAAYALRLGASGLTFYDDEVLSFFGPSAAGKSVMFLIAVGRPARRRPVP